MIWHIVRKDLRLLWPMAVIVAAVNLTNAVLLTLGGTFARTRQLIDPGTLSWISNLALPAVGIIGLVLLVVSAIQQDPLPGTTQDWLTRPIPRSRLWAAKLIFVLLAGLFPIFAGDVAMGIAAHFRPMDVFAVSLTRSLALLCLVCLPAAMIAAVTRKLTDVLVSGIGLIVLGAAILIAFIGLGIPAPVMQSGYAWIILWIFIGVSAGLPLLLVPLQLRWRSTHRVRWILLFVCCVLPVLFFIPWNAAIRIQQAIEGQVRSALNINEDGSRQVTFQKFDEPRIGAPKTTWIWLSVPLSIEGAKANERVYVDRVAIRVVGLTGQEIYRGNSQVNGTPGPTGFLLLQEGGFRKDAPEITLAVPAEIFAIARSAHAKIEVDLNLTEFALSVEKPLGSLVHDFPDEHTRCGERQLYGFKVMNCESTREIGDCFEIREPNLAASNTKLRSSQCAHGTYAPWPLPIWRDPYYSIYYGGLGTWSNPVLSRMGPDRTVPLSGLLLDSYLPNAHVLRSISFPIDNAIEKPKGEVSHSVDGIGPAARFAAPGGAVVDQRGNLFIVDRADSVIRRVTLSGEVSTFAGTSRQVGREDGSGQDARFSNPFGIGIDSKDNLYVADTGNGLIRKITPTGVVSTVMSVADKENPISSPLRFKRPIAVTPAGDGALYVIDHDETNGSAAVVKRIAPNGVVSNVAGPATDGKQPPP